MNKNKAFRVEENKFVKDFEEGFYNLWLDGRFSGTLYFNRGNIFSTTHVYQKVKPLGFPDDVAVLEKPRICGECVNFSGNDQQGECHCPIPSMIFVHSQMLVQWNDEKHCPCWESNGVDDE